MEWDFPLKLSCSPSSRMGEWAGGQAAKVKPTLACYLHPHGSKVSGMTLSAQESFPKALIPKGCPPNKPQNSPGQFLTGSHIWLTVIDRRFEQDPRKKQLRSTVIKSEFSPNLKPYDRQESKLSPISLPRARLREYTDFDPRVAFKKIRKNP